MDCLYGLLLCCRARGLLRHHVNQVLGTLPECAIAHAIGNQIAGVRRLVGEPFLHRVLRQCVGENLDIGRRYRILHDQIPPLHFFGRKSMTRLALPCERSMVPGSTTRTRVVTPT